jgi:hypothetical protein
MQRAARRVSFMGGEYARKHLSHHQRAAFRSFQLPP